MIDLNDVLLAMSNIPVDDPIAEMWGRGLQGGYKIIEYTGFLPITIRANGDALIDYRIYGADGGVGEPTENLFDEHSSSIHGAIQSDGSINANVDATTYNYIAVEPNTVYRMKAFEYTTGYEHTARIAWYDENEDFLYRDYIMHGYETLSKTSPTNAKYCRISINNNLSKFVLIKESAMPTSYIPYGYKLPMVTAKNLFNPDGTYETNKFKDDRGAIKSYNNAGYYTQYIPINSEDLISVKNVRGDKNLAVRLYYYDSQKNWIGRSGGNGYVTDFTETPLPGAAFIQLQIGMPYTTNADKIIISQGGTTTPVYIGENQLGEDEYVSYSEQKIYRNVSGTLTPTDPPVPFHGIPTIKGETIIDYDGDPKPSQMYVKYKDKG